MSSLGAVLCVSQVHQHGRCLGDSDTCRVSKNCATKSSSGRCLVTLSFSGNFSLQEVQISSDFLINGDTKAERGKEDREGDPPGLTLRLLPA